MADSRSVPGNDPQSSAEGRPVPRHPETRRRTWTQYQDMVNEYFEIPAWKNAIAGLCHWVVLAGFVVFPGTFTSIARSTTLQQNGAGRVLQLAVRNVPLIYVAAFACVLGVVGLTW